MVVNRISKMGARGGGGGRGGRGGGGAGLEAAQSAFQSARVQYKTTQKALSKALGDQWDEAKIGPVSSATTKKVLAAQKAHNKSKTLFNKTKSAVEKLVGHKLQWDASKQNYV